MREDILVELRLRMARYHLTRDGDFNEKMQDAAEYIEPVEKGIADAIRKFTEEDNRVHSILLWIKTKTDKEDYEGVPVNVMDIIHIDLFYKIKPCGKQCDTDTLDLVCDCEQNRNAREAVLSKLRGS